MYAVYKITNQINGKYYIGSSIKVEKRWKDHKNASMNPNNPAYNYPLQTDFREFGIDNFTFEILKNDFETVLEMEDYEFLMIDQLDATNPEVGYNQTKFTHNHMIVQENIQKYLEKISQPCAWVDKYNNIIEKYTSYSEAAKIHTGKENCASNIREVCQGRVSSYKGKYFRDLDKKTGEVQTIDFKNRKARKMLIGINVDNPMEEIYFESITQAAEVMGTDRWSITQCISGVKRYSIVKGYIWREIDLYGNIIQNEIDIDQRLQEYDLANPVINGERHCVTEWCRIYNISHQSYLYRRKKGMGVVEAITTPKRR